jgi:hypothetical protein
MGGPPVDNAETRNDVSGDRDAFELPVTVELDPTDTLQKLGFDSRPKWVHLQAVFRFGDCCHAHWVWKRNVFV